MLHISSFIKKDLDRQNKLPAKWYPELPDKPITDKCFIYVDAINNTGSGHSNSATTWKNLMGGTNGSKVGSIKWQDDALVLTRTEKQANGFRFMTSSPSAVTIEAVFSIDGDPVHDEGVLLGSSESVIVGCPQSGGVGSYLMHNESFSGLTSLANDKDLQTYVIQNLHSRPEKGRKIYTCLRVDSSKLISNTSLSSARFESKCSLRYADKNRAPWAIGYNSHHESPWFAETLLSQFIGKVYSVRIHSRVLTDEEIHKNMLYERNRYNF